MPPDIRALIFDLDGVITNTVELHSRSWAQLAHDVGLDLPPNYHNLVRGVSRRESLNRILDKREIDEETAQEWMRRKNMYYLAHISFLTPKDILPGVVQLLDDIDAAGLKKGVASSSMNAQFVLRKLELYDRFTAIADPTKVPRTKPEPDLFMWTAGALGVSPNEAMVIEDAEDGVRAALAAGFRVVGLGDANVQGAHLRLPSLENARLDAMLAALPND